MRQAPKIWVGSESVNVLQVLGDLIELVQQMNTQLAAHIHISGPIPSPTYTAVFTADAAKAELLGSSLKTITALRE